MTLSFLRSPALTVFCSLFSLLALPTQSFAGLTTINNPGGGKIVYGQIDGQSTESGAMAYVLHAIHQQFGDKPQVGRLFQVRGTESVACFFSVTRKTVDGGHHAGMLIVAKAATDHVEAAVVSDDAAHLSKSLNPMLKTLLDRWHPLDSGRVAAPGGTGTATANGPVLPMRKVVLPDHSAWMDVPQGWRVDPASTGGSMGVGGPSGEMVLMGLAFLAQDTNNPAVRQSMMRGFRNNYYPYGGDLAKTFVDLSHSNSQRLGQPAATFQIEKSEAVQSPPPVRCAHLFGHVDLHDGKGQREMNTIYCAQPPTRFGNWLSTAYEATLPMAVADKERATIGAMLRSWGEDPQVISREAGQIAAPAINAIHAIGAAVDARIAASHQADEIRNSSVYEHWDNIDRRSQEFSNYQLGYSVIQDNENNAHGTFWNDTADALVKHDPQRYEYVNAPNYWKGIDY